MEEDVADVLAGAILDLQKIVERLEARVKTLESNVRELGAGQDPRLFSAHHY